MWLALDHELRGRRSLWDHLDPDGHLEALNQRLKTSVRAAKLHGHLLETEARGARFLHIWLALGCIWRENR